MTQLGTQHASGIGDRMTVQFLKQAGDRQDQAPLSLLEPARRHGALPAGGTATGGRPEPAHLDWDKWIGTAPMRDYAPDVYHPDKWRAWLDFGTGWSGDIGCHIFDAPWKGLGLQPPELDRGRGAGLLEELAGPPRRHLAPGRSHHLGVPRQ